MQSYLVVCLFAQVRTVPIGVIALLAFNSIRGAAGRQQKSPGQMPGSNAGRLLARHRSFGVSRALITHGSAMMDGVVVMVVVPVVEASRPRRGAGKGICWDGRNTNNNQRGDRDDSSKRHDKYLPQTAGLDSCQTQRLWLILASARPTDLKGNQCRRLCKNGRFAALENVSERAGAIRITRKAIDLGKLRFSPGLSQTQCLRACFENQI